MSADPSIRAIVRDARRSEKAAALGPCGRCGSDRDVSATLAGPRCYEHRVRVEAAIEAHHPAGIANVPGWTIRLTGNAHRDLSEAWTDLGFDSLPPSGGNPLLVAAYTVAGLAVIGVLVVRWLAELAAWLAEHFGPGWWDGAPPFPAG
jgi:hypothetical protein